MRYISVCSGIESATVAWHPLGWTPAAFAEIDKFPCAVLAHHYPAVPLHGDFTTIEAGRYGAVDLLVGGTPCQDFSIAGLRAGIAGERGNLTLEFLRLAARTRARWIVWENVPGVLSSDGGRALGAFLGGLAELGYGFAYRVLDAQHFGLAQRRARVFVVGHLGDWRRAAAVLFERESLQGHPAPRREAGEGIARPITPGSPGGSGYRNDADTADNLIAPPLTHNPYGDHESREGLRVMAHGQANAEIGRDQCPTLTLLHEAPILAHAFDARQSDVIQYGDKIGPLDTDGHTMAIAFSMKDHGADAGPLSPTLRAGGFDKSHANGGVMPAVAFESRFARNGRGAPDTIVPPLKAQSGTNGKGDGAPLVAFGGNDASASEADAAEILRALQAEVGTEAFAEWRSRILVSLQTPEILRSAMHGAGIRRAAREAGRWLDDGALARAQSVSVGTLRKLWEEGPDGRSPQGLRLAQQLAEQLGTTLSQLPSARPSGMQVRRLTPKECERLMGFPDDYTLIPWRGKLAPDGPRYKALGNSMAVPVMAWIGRRIAEVDAISQQQAA